LIVCKDTIYAEKLGSCKFAHFITEIQNNYISHESNQIYVILIQIIGNEKKMAKITRQKISFFLKLEISAENRYFGHKSKFWSKRK